MRKGLNTETRDDISVQLNQVTELNVEIKARARILVRTMSQLLSRLIQMFQVLENLLR